MEPAYALVVVGVVAVATVIVDLVVVAATVSRIAFVVPRSRQSMWTVVAVTSVVMALVTALVVAGRIVDIHRFVLMRRDSRLVFELRMCERCPSVFP